MAEYTKGPWTHSESVGGKWYIYGADGKPVFVRNVAATHRSSKENAANDKLMAAAPEMADALMSYYDAYANPALLRLLKKAGIL